MERGMIAVIESDVAVRVAMTTLLESMGFATKASAGLADALRDFDATRTAAVVVGCQDSGATELELLFPLLEQQPAARVILLTDGSPTSLVVKAMRAGISSVLEHPFAFADLVEAVRIAFEENHQRLREERKCLPREVSEILTRQEEDIALLLIDGAATKEIASKLNLSVRTIHYRKNSILKKIGAESRDEAIKKLTRNLSLEASAQA